MISYGVVSSPTSPPIQPPRVRNLLVRALRATPRGNKIQRNSRLWDVAHPLENGRSGLRKDATTKPRSTDLWFNGFTPNLQATVWFGMDQPQPLYVGATSGEATPVWGEFMRLVYLGELLEEGEAVDLGPPIPQPLPLSGEDAESEGSESEDFGEPLPDLLSELLMTEEEPAEPIGVLPIPEPWPLDGLTSLEVDSETGMLASPWCPAERRYIEHYLPGTEPTEECDDSAPGRSILRWPW